MAKRVKTNYDRGYVNAMDKIRVFIESSSKVMYVDATQLHRPFLQSAMHLLSSSWPFAMSSYSAVSLLDRLCLRWAL